MTLKDNLRCVREAIEQAALRSNRSPNSIQLIAVSKGRPLGDILEAHALGLTDFGESKVQEALPKIVEGPSSIRWHFIGHLQRNKVAHAVGKFALIHSVDSPLLAEKISEISLERGLTTKILLQVNTSGEESKKGLKPELWSRSIEQVLSLPALEIHGLMTMAPLTKDKTLIRASFRRCRELFEELRDPLTKAGHPFQELSMGMSGDFPIAIEEGATLIRLGSSIFDFQH